MAKNNDSTIIYQDQMDICMQRLDDIQLGRLMRALFQIDNGEEPDVEDDPVLAMALAFMSLQKRVDRKKYEERCETNRRNGLKGGAPKGNKNASKGKQPQNNLETTSKQPNFYQQKEAENANAETLDIKGLSGKKQPKQPNAKKNNPNDNENDNDNDNDNDDDKTHDGYFSFGQFQNVQLTETERAALKQQYENSNALIEKVSVWLRSAKNDVPDHYGLCLKFAANDDWPKRRRIEPVEPIKVTDPLSEEEQREKVVEMKARLNKAFSMG